MSYPDVEATYESGPAKANGKNCEGKGLKLN